MSDDSLTIWTIGHSTRSLDEFLQLLAANQIEVLADVRRFAGSRKNPQFGRDALAQSLQENGVEYIPFPELGGRRRPRPDSHNTVWRNESFRAYADYMETEAYRGGIQRLLELARRRRTVIMCSEAVWWRCHRSMIADDLKARGVCVQHILSPTQNKLHPYTSAAQITNGHLAYGPALPASGADELPSDCLHPDNDG